ncbi:MAG: response regulator [Pseudohongiellaceae bacterium]
MEEPKHALVLEDNPETQQWLSSCVEGAFPSIKVVQAETLAAALVESKAHEFELALVDLGLPDGSGLDFIRTLTASSPACHIIVATIYDDDKNLFSALRSGAQGYILKDQDQDKIVSYLQGIKHNKPAISAASSKRLIEHFNVRGAELESELSKAKLTARETEVTQLVSKGYSAEEAAELLGLSPDTIRGYVKTIYQKLEVNNRSELTLKAMKLGFISSD